MHTKTQAFATLTIAGGFALALAGPAQAVVPERACTAATYAVSAGPDVDRALVGSVRDALTQRGLTPAEGVSDADLRATIAPADEVEDKADPTVMAVALSVEEINPAQARQGSDWAPAAWTDGATAVNQLLDQACGAQEPRADAQGSAADQAEGAAAADAAAKESADRTVTTGQDSSGQSDAAETSATETAADRAAEQSAQQAAASTAQDQTTQDQVASAQTAERKAPGVGVSAAADKDCADFATQAQAQAYYVSRGGPASDPDDLDRDDDAVACENHFSGDATAPIRAEARTINAGVPEVAGANPFGIAGGAVLALTGLGLAVRARRLT